MSDTKKITTPLGEARFFCLGKEETFEGKGSGKQTASIIFKGDALKQITKEVDEFISEQFTPKEIASGVNSPFKKTKDGDAFLKAKAYVSTKEGKPVNIPISDRKGNFVKAQVEIGNGSVVRLRVVLSKTKFQGKLYVGVKLVAVQLVKLVEYNAGGFDGVDGYDDEGFDADEFSAPASDAPKGNAYDDDEIPF